MKRRVLAVVGTRPEAVKMAPLVRALQAEPWAEVRLLSTGQHGAMVDHILAGFGLRADIALAPMPTGQGLADLAARTMAAIDPVLAAERPALVLAQGDTHAVLVAALCAHWRRIDFGHVEAGLRTGRLAEPFPEESNRTLVSRLARWQFAPTAGARDHLLREGIAPASIHVVGNTVIDALQWTARHAAPSAHAPQDGRRLLLVTAHRRENLGAPLRDICGALRRLAARGDLSIVFPVHPNPEVRGLVQAELAGIEAVRLVEPLAYAEMVAAMLAATVILTDSGGLQEEAPALGRPLVVLRRHTERPEAVDAGAAVLAGTATDDIVAAVTRLLDDPAAYAAMARPRALYGDGRSAEVIVKVLREDLG